VIPKVSDIIQIIEQLYPLSLSEKWDNSGLQIGSKKKDVYNILIALDPLLSVIQSCKDLHVDLLITHHPLFIKQQKIIDYDSYLGSVIKAAVLSDISIYSVHTNIDKGAGGLNDIFAQKIGLKNIVPLIPSEKLLSSSFLTGIGRIGTLEKKTDFKTFVQVIKKKFGINSIKISGNPDMPVFSVAVCTGSGSFLTKDFIKSKADVYISGDIKYHDAQNILENKSALIDIGHFKSEQFFIKHMSQKIAKIIIEKSFKVKIISYDTEKDPFVII
jgi:dinuclear metal center YbgI/SA1388 family protein